MSTIEDLHAQIQALTSQLEAEKRKNEQLEDECDLLAMDNDRLRTEVQELHRRIPVHDTSLPAMASAGDDDKSASSSNTIALDVFIVGDGQYANRLRKHIQNASSGKNVLSTSIYHSVSNDKIPDVVFCGGVDAYLRGYDVSTGIEIYGEKTSAPVLCIDSHDPYVACGMMDGSMMVMMVVDEETHPVQINFKDHSKYVIAIKWSRDGQYLATAGHDRYVHIYKKK